MNILSYPLQTVDSIGAKFFRSLRYTRQVLQMLYLSVRAALFHGSQSYRTILSVVSSQVYFTGVQALPLISGIALATSSLVVMQSSSQFNIIGSGNLIGSLMVVIIIREMAPLLTALIVIARSGTAIASEIGNMRVNREIEALEVMGINPLGFIIFPRLVGGVLSLFCLSLYFIYISIVGGFLFAKVFLGMSFEFYIDSIMQVVAVEDAGLFIVKNVFSGAIVFAVSCYQGMQVKNGPHEVPQATTSAVVNSIIYVVGFNALATIAFYLNQLIKMGIL